MNIERLEEFKKRIEEILQLANESYNKCCIINTLVTETSKMVDNILVR